MERSTLCSKNNIPIINVILYTDCAVHSLLSRNFDRLSISVFPTFNLRDLLNILPIIIVMAVAVRARTRSCRDMSTVARQTVALKNLEIFI